jgi:hypothetical protein
VRNGSSKISVSGANQSREARERKKPARNRSPVSVTELASAHSRRDSRKKHQKQRDSVRRLELKQNVVSIAGNDYRVQEQVNSPVAIEAWKVDEEAEENERSTILFELAQQAQQMIQIPTTVAVAMADQRYEANERQAEAERKKRRAKSRRGIRSWIRSW